ncbi:hypothetical protein [Prosthecobacter sp.]|uniref:hypothetical protein n=1 Tax=Prosthecobacter sp. TaxID=1965333 RepID=UPI0037847AAD
MSNTIEVLSADSMKNQYWGQYKTLATLLNETLGVLRALKAEGVPADVPTGPIAVTEPVKPMVSNSTAADLLSRYRAKPTQFKTKTLSDLVRDAASTIRTRITAPGIVSYIRGVDPSREINMSSLSALISQISREEDWKLVEKGMGGQPNVYALAEVDPLS